MRHHVSFINTRDYVIHKFNHPFLRLRRGSRAPRGSTAGATGAPRESTGGAGEKPPTPSAAYAGASTTFARRFRARGSAGGATGGSAAGSAEKPVETAG